MSKEREFEICARAVIVIDDRFLVCKRKSKEYFFFPGGHVEFFEKAENALKRELKEELDIEINKKMVLMGIGENMYKQDNERRHEVNFFYLIDPSEDIKDKSLEDHIDFSFLAKNEFLNGKVLPSGASEYIVKWLEDRKMFFMSSSK